MLKLEYDLSWIYIYGQILEIEETVADKSKCYTAEEKINILREH